MNIADELHKLHELRESGAINNDEYTLAKARILSAQQAAPPEPQPIPFAAAAAPEYIAEEKEQQTRLWAMFLHFSVLAGFVLPLAGLILPIVIWQWKKVELPGIDVHGKNAVNWIISAVIYAAGCLILVFVFIGIPLLIALLALFVIFPIVAGIKANQGEVWKYPMAITFLN
jgi:uncharacterized Tic20 family protein